MFPKIEAFLIRCTTGCSCCRNENELHGPWRTLEAAELQAKIYERWPLVSSQYAAKGLYEIIRTEAEQLPDGRLILDGRLISAGFVFEGERERDDDALLRGEHIDLIEGKSVRRIGSTSY